jgi:sigma-B regulation protein RsbU (phosphoserine phosphatase)
VRLEGELVARELSLAAKIQESFLSQTAPQMGGVEMGFQCLFARTVGGDLYDWVPLGERRLGVCVGDVSGKGVPAALYMAKAISEFRSLVPSHDSPSSLLEALNARLTSTQGQGIFVTLLYLILDLDSKIISLSNAGHEPPYLYRQRAGKGEWFRKGGAPPLGLFAETCYSEEKIPMEEGDFLVLVSDGVRELRSPRGEEFGYEGMEKALDSFSRNSAGGVVQHLFQAMDEFSRKIPAHDDRTVLCLKIGGKG